MDEVKKYFDAEWKECVLGVGIGVVAAAKGAILLAYYPDPLYHGIAYSFLAAALAISFICATVIIRAPKDIVRVNAMLTGDRSRIASEEIPRMEAVLRHFVIYRYLEIAAIIAGIGAYFLLQQWPLIQGIFVGAAIMGFIFVIFDYFAEARGKHYLAFLTEKAAN